MKNQQKILIIKFGALGDVLLASGQVQAILARHSGDSITILTEPAMIKIFKPMLQYGKKNKKNKIHFLTITRKHYWRLPWLMMTLWRKNFKRVYDLQTSGYSNRLHRLLWVKPLWNGVVKNIWQDKSKDRASIHAVERFNRQLAVAGIGYVPPPNVDYLHGKKFSFFKKKFFMLVIGGSSSKTKQKQILPLATYIAVAKFLETKNIFSVLVGGKLEVAAAEKFMRAVPSAINLVAKTTLGDVAEVARRADGVIGNDTGLTHLAALAQLPGRSAVVKKRKAKKTIPIVVVIAPPAVPATARPLGDTKKSIHVVYSKNVENITAADIIRHLPTKL